MGKGQSSNIAKAVNKQNTSKLLLYKLYFKIILKSFDFQCYFDFKSPSFRWFDFDFKIINIWWFFPSLSLVQLILFKRELLGYLSIVFVHCDVNN